ncbi:pantetheine-phosphate adenylyltransferase [Carboxydochorda subterranea]|uniref:Phosphopantetheine adenylyltransferase n=1 Tax=Carboxydichorda subterranea TaxID=3109565 RepID=A0ABZ1C0Y3_9FIRM|nr:pantetheine-phosphate adenylyltransferase [Limnochorda sp. L945t]WRP18411.1 pantetheine-phosphate adenylyltransferase [Limnochorda sp. L945t]
MSVAVYPGSFDPVTFGHLDIITRAAALFDTLYVAVLQNPSKQPLFSVEERLAMLQEACRPLSNVRCETFSGLVVDYARSRHAIAIVRGLRAVSDFEYEFVMATMNRNLESRIDTVFIVTSSEYAFISSSLIKEVARFGGDVGRWVPPGVAERLRSRFSAGDGAGGAGSPQE